MQGLTSALQLAPELSVSPLLGGSAASHPLKQMLPLFGQYSLLNSVIFLLLLAMHLP